VLPTSAIGLATRTAAAAARVATRAPAKSVEEEVVARGDDHEQREQRSIDLTPALRESLVLWRAESKHTGADDYVLPTSTGRKHNPSNLRRDVLRPAVEAANARLAKDGIAPIADELGFHGLGAPMRRSAPCAATTSPITSAQIGHEDPRFTLRCYAQATKRRERLSGPHLRSYDWAIDWARMGTIEAEAPAAVSPEATKSPV
jgi:hypothetical protein